jgi:hypothetical protein
MAQGKKATGGKWHRWHRGRRLLVGSGIDGTGEEGYWWKVE